MDLTSHYTTWVALKCDRWAFGVLLRSVRSVTGVLQQRLSQLSAVFSPSPSVWCPVSIPRCLIQILVVFRLLANLPAILKGDMGAVQTDRQPSQDMKRRFVV